MSQSPVAAPQQQTLAGMPQRLYAASPSRLLTWLDCPRRYRMTYLDRPRPIARPQRAHTSLGLATHNALRDYWDLAPAERTPAAGGELVRRSWISLGFRDEAQSSRWRERTSEHVKGYLQRRREMMGAEVAPIGVERTVALKTSTIALSGRVDRLDDRDGELVVVDYKTSRSVPTEDDARTSLALALYAVAVSRMFRRPCVRVELHHVATGSVAAHDHTPESLGRKVAEAESIARDLRAVDAEFAEVAESSRFAPRTTPLCAWCDLRAHCPTGQLMGAEKSSWAALDPD